MKLILSVGHTGEGKSEFVKEFIGTTRNCIVMDIQNEYGPYPKYPGQTPLNLSSNVRDDRSRYIGGDFDEYLNIVLNKKNTVCVFEEATIFLEGRIGFKMRKIITNKMFTKNVYILCFHSICSIPPRILQLADYVVLYRTHDEENQVKKKYPSLLKEFVEIKSNWDAFKGKRKVIKRT